MSSYINITILGKGFCELRSLIRNRTYRLFPDLSSLLKHIVIIAISSSDGTTTVTDLTTVPVEKPSQVRQLLKRAAKNRATGATQKNDRSSRSHRYDMTTSFLRGCWASFLLLYWSLTTPFGFCLNQLHILSSQRFPNQNERTQPHFRKECRGIAEFGGFGWIRETEQQWSRGYVW